MEYVAIPLEICRDKNLSASAKLIYGQISYLANLKGYCYASNSYLADISGLSTKTVTRAIMELKTKGYLVCKFVPKTVEPTGRRIYLVQGPDRSKKSPEEQAEEDTSEPADEEPKNDEQAQGQKVPTYGQKVPTSSQNVHEVWTKCPDGMDKKSRRYGQNVPQRIKEKNNTKNNIKYIYSTFDQEDTILKKGEREKVEATFERLWSLYPEKRGKSRVSLKAKKEIHRLGFDRVKTAMDRYLAEVQRDRRNGFRSLRYAYGSTFFNSRYVDYLDDEGEENDTRRGFTDERSGISYKKDQFGTWL